MTHIVKNEKSLIAKIYGIFSVSIERREPMYYLLLENLDPFQKQDILFKYDWKFSKKNRFHLKKRLKVEQYRNLLMKEDPAVVEILK